MIAEASQSVVQIGATDGLGSGFVLDTPAGKAVVTNAHVVGTDATVSLWVDGLSLGEAQALGVDEYLDLALIRLRDDQVSRGRLTALRLGNSDTVGAGQDVFVLGYPQGYSGPPSLARGVVSRSYTETMDNGEDVTVIQTDAAVNAGNSGGPLLDRSGAVMGVIFAREVDGATGIAYATSSNDLRRVLRDLSEGSTRLVPTPSPTPVPTPTAGGWRYFGPDCPDAYTNCVATASEDYFISLKSYFWDTNPTVYNAPNILVACFHQGKPSVQFGAGGLPIALDTVSLYGIIHPGDFDWSDSSKFVASGIGDSANLFWVDKHDSKTIIQLIQAAEKREGETLTFGAINDHDDTTVVADFNVSGFTLNFERLPCSQDN